MNPVGYFRDDFCSAREFFVDVCQRKALVVESNRNPAPGPDDEPLYTDIVRIGPENASNLIVLISGTHGVETLCGSACQSGFVESEAWRQFGDDTAILLIHALNCWGAAHLRRNNEDNVDLSRNFADFDKPLPENQAYESLHEALCADGLDEDAVSAGDGRLARFVEENGIMPYVTAVMGGQYRHADGFAYGGDSAVWSNRLLMSVLRQHGGNAVNVYVIEYHSGLGPYAYGLAVTLQTGTALARVRKVYGQWVDAPEERQGDDGLTMRVTGHPTHGFLHALPDAKLCAIVLEYGTYPPDVSLPVLIADHRLHRAGHVATEPGKAVKRRLLELHHPADPEWRRAVWDRSCQVLRQTAAAIDQHE